MVVDRRRGVGEGAGAHEIGVSKHCSLPVQRRQGLGLGPAAVSLGSGEREYNHLGHRAITQYIPTFPDGVQLSKEPATLPAPDAARKPKTLPARRAGRLPAPDAGQVSSQKARGPRRRASRPKITIDETSYLGHQDRSERLADAMLPFVETDDPGAFRAFYKREYVAAFVPGDEHEEFMATAGRAEALLDKIHSAVAAALDASNGERAKYLVALADDLEAQLAAAVEAGVADRKRNRRVPA